HYVHYFSLQCSDTHRDLHSFPTRRSSDLGSPRRSASTLASRAASANTVGSYQARAISARARGAVSGFVSASARSIQPWTSSESRSEEHTSELQSLAYLVCRLLLEKKKKTR